MANTRTNGEQYRYTNFPNLHDIAEPSSDLELDKICHEFWLPEKTQRDAVISSWALLLRGYTGASTVVFGVDDRAVCVDFENKTVEDVAVLQSPEGVARETAILFTELQTNAVFPAIYLQVDLDASNASLVASAFMLPGTQVPGLISQFQNILSYQPTSPSSSVPPFTVNAQHRENLSGISVLNPDFVKIPGPELLHELVGFSDHHNHHTSDPINAIEFLAADGRRTGLSYERLHSLSNHIAKDIDAVIDRSAGRKSIPVLLPQSPLLYVALLAILKSGAAFVPLNLDTPEERIRFVVEDVEASVIITNSHFSNKFNWENAPTILKLDEDGDFSNRERWPCHPEKIPMQIAPTDPAYIMYTSGSTGKPKGVIVSHSAASQSLLAHNRHIPQFHRFLQFAAPTFDVSVFEIFFPLFRGCTLVGCDRGRLLADLPQVINEMNIDGAELTPTVAGEILGKRELVPGLKVLLTIGEMLTRRVIDEFGNGVLQGMYGPTEAAIHCTLATNFKRDAKVGDIGIPLDTVSAFVVAPAEGGNSDIDILPVGWVGELVIGGNQLADGYLKRPDITKDVFITSQRWGNLYRTGDRARILPSGRIECLGRVAAGQVKLRGQRVELGEIEEVVLKAPGAKMAVASVVNNSLVIYVSSSEPLHSESVKQLCRRWLPSFMVPSDVVLFEDLPRLPSGKADRKLLDKDYSQRLQQLEGAEDEFLTETEKVVVDTVEEILKFRAAKTQSLSSIGLDSILAIRLATKLRAKGIKVEVLDIISSDTVAGISAAVLSVVNGTTPLGDIPAVKDRFQEILVAGKSKLRHLSLGVEIHDIIPCTSLQEAMLAETVRDGNSYCNWLLLSLPSTAEPATVKNALFTVIQRNEILRTGFIALETGFAQVIWNKPQNTQFAIGGKIEEGNWSVSLEELMTPPFSAQFVTRTNGGNVLSIRIHHAVYDGWSWENILSQFQLLLSGSELASSQHSQFRKVVEWELAYPADRVKAAQSFWSKKLEGVGETRLPNFNGRDVEKSVSVEHAILSTSRLEYEQAARSAGVSPQVLVQSAWSYLLGLYVGKDDIVFGTVVSGRTISLEGIEEIIGPTILTLPVRVQTGLERTMGDVMDDVQKFNRDLLQHTELGLREVRKASGGEVGFDSLLVWQQTANDTVNGAVEVISSRDKLEFSLLIEAEPKAEEIHLRVTFKEEILPRAQVTMILKQLDRIVQATTENPRQKLRDILPTIEDSLLSIENPAPKLVEASSTRTLATCFEEASSKYPDNLALEFASDIRDGNAQTTKVTFSTLNASANQLARELIERGTFPDDLVVVCMEKSVHCYVSILAVVKAGAGYLPLTADTPPERVKQIISNAGVKLVLTTQDVSERLGEIEDVRMLNVENIDISKHSIHNPDVSVPARSLGYAVFTSGSTGVPKGVLVEHEQAVGMLDTLADIYPTAPGKRMLQFCSIAFDVSVFEIFFTWARGMCLCSGTKDVILRDIESFINVLQVTHLSMTPTVAALVNPENVPGVEFLVTAGEAVTKKVFNDWAGRGLYQGYGPSETTNICSVLPRVQTTDNISNIGPPFVNTSAFVVVADDTSSLTLLPRGSVGELCFGGVQVCRGYLRMPELTSAKFVTHPKFGRIYRSGDIGRLLPSGEILIQGRLDDQVKIRGNRIELGEITSVILKQSAVLDATTLVISNKALAPQLVAFVAMKEHMDTEFRVVNENESSLQKHLATLFETIGQLLPGYMVPNAIVPLSVIPMTSQGKTDKKLLQRTFLNLSSNSLERFSSGATSQDNTSRKEWTETEKIIASVLAAVAQVNFHEITRNTSIYKLGLDSISAIHLSTRLGKCGFARPDVSQIMRNPTVPSLARMLMKQPSGKVQEQIAAGAAAIQEFASSVRDSVLEQLNYSEQDIDEILPCTPLQEAMLSTKKGADPRGYYNHTVFNLKADPNRLQEAWIDVMKTHNIMRTCFAVTSHPQHAYAQVVIKHHELPWNVYAIPEPTESIIEEHISKTSSTMDTSRPPYSFGLLKSPKGSTLVMSFHHSLYDGFAMELLLQAVKNAYSGVKIPQEIRFIHFLEYMESADLAAADAFWKELLAGLESPSFPDLTGKSNSFRKSLTGMSARKHTCSMPLSSINEICRHLSTSLQALGQAAWARILAVYTSESDICFGNVVSGRTVPVEGVEKMVAPCFNTVPIRVQVLDTSTNLSIMESLQKVNADIIPHQLTPLRRIMSVLKTEGQGLFDTLFILQNNNEQRLDDLWEELEDRGEMDFSIVMELVPSHARDALEVVVHYRRDVLLDEQIEVLLNQFDAMVKSSLMNSQGLALNFDTFDSEIMSEANRNPTYLTSNGPGLLHSELERLAQEVPNHTALEWLDKEEQNSSWTFGEINRASNQIAHHLISLDVRRDEAIPLCIEKSPLYYICVIAVLKAGCAFTPIDPSLPEQRKAFMIKELGARYVLSNTAARHLKFPDVQVIDIESLSSLSEQPTVNPVVQDLSEICLAYRLYTSGSTGQPKAVSMEHRSAIQTIRQSKSIIPWTSESRMLQFAATTFDMCYYDLFMAWSYGFTLCSATAGHLLGDLERTISRMNISILDLTPTVASTINAETLPGVKLLYCIGEAMPSKIVDSWLGRCVNSYGPTEAAMCCTITDVRSEIKAANIGYPFDTTKFAVLSKVSPTVLPIFAAGELCIGGHQLAREYHNNPELTASRFIKHKEETLYRTGDIVRQLPNGTFEFIGRADDQVKIRGLRVELDEISTVLRGSHESIRDTTTMVLKYSTDSKNQLVSFLALEDRKQHGTPPKVCSSDSVVKIARNVAQKMLPRYMVPGIMLVIDHMPLSAAGKVDKKTLGALFREQDIKSLSQHTNSETQEKWSENEQKMREVFSVISQVPVEQIHKGSTIYELGLDSISATQVALKLKREGLNISVLDILERPSIELLSAYLKTDDKGIQRRKLNLVLDFQEKHRSIIATNTNGMPVTVYPCTGAQEGMISQFLRSQGELYFNHIIFKLPADLNTDKLHNAWQQVFESLDILRSGFVELDDNVHPFATITHSSKTIQLPWFTKYTTLDNIDRVISEQKKIGATEALKNLHLPPWRLTLIQSESQNYLLFSGLHALYDATTLQIFYQDVAKFYHCRSIPERPQFGNILEEILRHRLDSNTVEEDKRFWLNQLEGSSICRMPNLCPQRTASKEYHVRSIEASWGLSEIEATCQKLGVSVHAAAQAAWARILSAYTGETALTMGVVFSGRTALQNAEDVAFPCLVTLPAVVALIGSNRQLAVDIQKSNTAALKHQHTPLRSIQRWFEHPEESFFDSLFVYQKTAGEDESRIWNIVNEDASADYAFSLEIEPTMTNKVLIRATAADNTVPSQQTELMIRQIDAALLDILKNPDRAAADLSSIPAELLSVTPAIIDEIPCETKLLHKFVEKHRELSPDKLAFEFVTAIDEDNNVTKQTWTYTQLDEEGNKIANFLLSNGVKTGNIVGISFEKIPEASFAILGILKAGCAYVAIDYSAPIDRKAFIVGDSKAALVLTQDKYLNELQAAVTVRVASAESESEIHTASFETPVITDLTPDNLSYCLYTSGTTGTPKGCELTHENAVQAMLAFQRLFAGHWDADSKWLQFASFHFDVSVLEQYWSWSVGICVTSAPRDLIFQDLAGTIDTLQITHLDLTPSLAALLSPEDVPSLCRGVFITGGEALKQEILDKWGETGVIYNGYGPTEVTIGCTMYPRVPANGKPSNIGPQFDNVGSYVFAPGTERPVPRGAIGELCASGKLVGRGYLNRPDLTNEKFPLLKEYNERIYRTGDLVRILHDGTFDFTGRADDQVKLRGQRLEIGEINEVVKKAPNAEIQAVTTLVLRHPKQQKDQLVSFVILGSESEIPTERGITPFVRTGSEHAKIISHLVAACKTKLPTYMVPTHFLPVSHMPLSINNKVDNKSLKALYEATTLDVLQRLSRVEEDKGDWNDAEKKLRDVLMHITGLQSDEIRRSSTIFELGLDSVAVVGLARRLNRSGFTGASPSLLLQNPVLSHMANMLSQASDSSSEGNARLQETRQKIGNFALDNLRTITQQLNVDRDSIANILQCTSLQEGMIARFLDSDKPLYFNSFPMLLKSTTDITALKKAWETVAASADILRTCFCETEDGYAQVILKNAALRWDKVELNDGSEDFEEAVRQGLQRSIDSNRDLHLPPISILLITSSTKVMLSLNIFHAIYDGTSLPIILNDIAKAYSGTFGVRTIQFGDVIPHLLTMQEGAKEFWQQNIKVSNSLPLDQLRGVSEPQDYSIEVSLSNNSAHIDDICKKLQCTAQAIFQAAWACALSTYIGRQVTLGVVVSGRSLSIEDIENVIGPTFNTIPCSVDVEAISWENIIGAIQAFNSGSIPFHNTPLRMIHKWLKRTSEQPLFDTLFVYQKGSVEEQGKEKLLWELCSGSTVADYPLSLEVAQAASGQINVTIVAKADLSREKVSRILQNFQNQLNRLLSNPRSAPLVQSETIEYENKVQDVGSKSSSNFEWNEQACILRKTIAKLSEVGEDKIDADSSILELGLDSIEAIKLSSRLRRHGIKISVSTIMRNTTIRKMQFAIGCENTETTSTTGNQLIATFENAARKQLENLKHVKDVESIYPTTPLQEAMIAETLASDYALYFNHDVLKLDARIDLQRLKIAWATVVRQSEILRTSFFALQNSRNQQTYGQLVHQFFNPEVTEFIVPEQNKVLGAIDDLMQQIKARADLLSEPPVYLSLVKGPEHTYLILSISHALYDGWSIGLLHKDLKQAYFGALKQRPSPRMLIENIFNTDARGSRDFWGQLLKGAVTSQFPTASETPNTADGTYRFERVCSISFSEVQAFCKTINTTVQSLGKACWGLLLAHLLGETDVLFGTVLSGRDFDPAEDIMFPAMNTVPVRVDLRGSYREVLQKLQDQGSMILKYQYTPLREIQKLVSTGGNRLFDTLFLYQPTQSTLEEDNSLYASVGGSSHVEYNVAVEMERCEEKIVWRNACKSTALNQTTAEAILESLDSLLAHIVRNPEHPALSFKESGMVIGNLPATQRRAQHTLNGIRIDLEEVASVAKSGHSSIKNCVAAIVKDDETDVLAAFLVTSDPNAAVPATIEGFKSKLPHWSMPTYIVILREIRTDGLQRTFSALPQADKIYCATAGANWTPLEGRIRGILAKIAGLPEQDIQRTQTIFHIGLDSISAIRLSSDLRKAGILLSVADILREATIERMALAAKSSKNISTLTIDTKAVMRKALERVDVSKDLTGLSENQTENILPVTSGQLYMLSAWRNSGYTLFMPTFTFTTSTPVELNHVQTAWESLIRQQPILRTSFRFTGNEDVPFVQVVSRNTPNQFTWCESSEVVDYDFLESIKRRERKKAIDMSLPPARLCAFKTPTETFLFLTIHHALYDGVSLQVLLSKLTQLLENRPSRLPTPDPEEPKFPEFVALAQVQDLAKQQKFWSTYLSGAQSNVLSWRQSRHLAHTRSSCYNPRSLAEAKLLESKCNHAGLSLQSVFLAAFAKVYLGHLTCSNDELVFGIYLSNRHFAIQDLASMAAPTLNLVPLRIRGIRATKRLVDLARRVQDDLVSIGTVENSVVNLKSIERWTGVTMDCFFNFIKLPGQPGASKPPSPSTGSESSFDQFSIKKKILLEEVDLAAEEMLAPAEVKGFLDTKTRDLDNIRTHMDIEVAVRGNCVDIGAFANAAFFREDELKELISEICSVVGEV